MFIHENLEYKMRNDLTLTENSSDEYDCLAVEILTNDSNKKNLILCLIYRSPSYNNERQFITSLELLLDKLQHKKKRSNYPWWS